MSNFKCRFCNEEFDSILDSARHICSKKKTKWSTNKGGRSKECRVIGKLVFR